MRVGGDARDPWDAEVEGGHGIPELFPERQDEAAQAPVDVQADPTIEGERTELGDRVDGAVGVVAGRADDDRGVVVDGGGHG